MIMRRRGMKPRCKSFNTKQEAEKWARDLEAQVDRFCAAPDTKILESTTLELALDQGVATKTHVMNLLHRLIDGKTTDGPDIDTPQALALAREPKANVERYDGLRVRIVGGRHAS